MKLKQSVNRLIWRFTDSNSLKNGFKPNQTDVDALNSILEFINKTNETTVQENRIFAKMYISYFCLQLRVTQDFDLAQKKTNHVLNTPLTTLYELLRVEANTCEIRNFFQSKGIDTTSLLESAKIEANKAKISEVNGKELLQSTQTWESKESYDLINAIITLAINEFKNAE